MRASMRADIVTCPPRYTPVVTVGPHTEVVDVETTVVTATRGLLVSLRHPGWSVVSE